MKAATKDTLRTIGGSKKRYIAILAICALGATMLTGLSMACLDLRESAEELYERQNLFDISVQSTYGLTNDDIDELAQVEGVESVEGGYEIETYTVVDGMRSTVELKTLLDSGMNEPYLVDGRLPEATDEVAVTENYLNESGKSIGDTVSFEDATSDDPTGLSDLETDVNIDDDADDADADDADAEASDDAEDEDPLIPGGTYTIVGTVIDPANITQPEGPIAFRASNSSDYTFFLTSDAVADTSTYTVAYLAVEGTEGLATYSDEYQDIVAEVQDRVEDVAPQREQARADEIKAEALDEIDDAEADANEQLADAEGELDDAQSTITESLAEALDGQRELDEHRALALAELEDAQALIDENSATLASGSQSLAVGQKELEENVQAFNAALPAAEQQLRDGQAQLDDARAEVDATLSELETQRAQLVAQADDRASTVQSLDTEVAGLVGTLTDLADDLEGAATENVPVAAGDVCALASTIDDAWTALGTVDATDESAATSAATSFVQAVAAAQQTLGNALTSDTAQDASARAAELAEQIAAYQEDIDGYDAEIDEHNDAITALEDQLAGLEADDPDRADLEDELAAEQEALASAQEARDAAAAQLADAEDELAQIQATLDALDKIQNAYTAVAAFTATDSTGTVHAASLASQRIQAGAELAGYQAAAAQLAATAEQVRTEAEAEFAAQQATIDAGWDALWDGYDQLVAAQQVLDASASQLTSGFAQLTAAQAELDTQRASALAQLEEAQAEIDDGLAQLADAQAELDDGRATFEEERDDALQQIADARAQVDDVEDATWYVQNCTQLDSVSSLDSDASSIEAIARVLPVIFFVVAILVSLTTATRMVDEERGLIGLYKALGYSNGRILAKYLIYTASAAFIGGILGDVVGFVVVPYVLRSIFEAMYLLPLFGLHFNLFYAVLGVAAFVVGITGATFISCRKDLAESPASLMRPLAPRAGSRILLERIRPLWNSLKFLNKVTARNLFRYKKRLLMTVFGVMGCTALLICGFSIKNTVETLAPRQYDQVYRYDLMAVTSADDYDEALSVLEDSGETTSLLPIGVDNITVESDGGSENFQLYVVPAGQSIDDYVTLQTLDGTPLDLDEADVVITNNAATLLGVDAGDTVEVTTSALDEANVTIGAVSLNYLSNGIYMTEDAYEDFFGDLELNGFYARLAGDDDEQLAFADELESDELFLTVSSVAELEGQFEESFTLINVVVYVVIVLAAGLAFVVLFTLSTVNIGEREREIATIKVLGFRQSEVRAYINKEMLVLTVLGILVGLPAGWALSKSFTYILVMPSIYFDVVVAPWCYALAAALSIGFALIVILITNRMLDRIDMVEALKSPE